MKKICCLLLALFLLVSFAACSIHPLMSKEKLLSLDDDDFFEGMDEEFGFRKKPAPAAKAEAAAPVEEAKPAEKPETPFRPAEFWMKFRPPA